MPEIPPQPLLENTTTLDNPVIEVETEPAAKDTTHTRKPLSGITGIVALGLVFVASASFAYSYVRDTLLESVPATEQVASVGTVHADAFAFVQLQAQSAYVYDLRTHRVLFALNPDAPRPLASLTKVATVLAVSEVLAPHSTITIPYDTAPLGRPERLTQGAVWKLQDVIDFTLVSSSNEGADILAQAANDAIHKQYPESPEAGATVWRMCRAGCSCITETPTRDNSTSPMSRYHPSACRPPSTCGSSPPRFRWRCSAPRSPAASS